MFAGKPPIFEKGELVGVGPKFYHRWSSRPNHPELSNRVWEVIKGCLEKIPSRRKTIAEVATALEAELRLR